MVIFLLFEFYRPFGLCAEVITEKAIEEFLIPCVVSITMSI